MTLSTATQNPQLRSLLESIKALPEDFHEAGVMQPEVLDALYDIATSRTLEHTAETGCGKTVLLLSWLSRSHTVFTLERYGKIPCESYVNVADSPLLRRPSTHFILGPTQETLPRHSFDVDFDLVLLDGPHGFPFPCMEYYYFYPRLRTGAILVVDDIHIPSVRMLHDFLLDEVMFELKDTIGNTAFFERTDQPTFNPVGDDWWLQGYNRKRKKTSRKGLYTWLRKRIGTRR